MTFVQHPHSFILISHYGRLISSCCVYFVLLSVWLESASLHYEFQGSLFLELCQTSVLCYVQSLCGLIKSTLQGFSLKSTCPLLDQLRATQVNIWGNFPSSGELDEKADTIRRSADSWSVKLSTKTGNKKPPRCFYLADQAETRCVPFPLDRAKC